ncbi:enoyl-CoA hydratase/isomerase family protein [Nocardia sp. NPDC006044]|uniref:enoyl-CoA hydratase/isomerase family protein n=1 Tax=Nocardia sp. NPDC006044 TaxID=3364306 RepID=UPI0036814928
MGAIGKQTVTVHPQPGGWTTVRLDNPPINLLDNHVYRELADKLERLSADSETKVVVLESADPDFFSAHFDGDLGPTAMAEVAAAYPRMMAALQSPRLVSIAKIRGRARGGGLELALLCDMRFAALDGTFLAQPEVTVGLIPGGGALQLLPTLIGRARALELILSGRNVDGATAERYGIVNCAVPNDELDMYVADLAARIAGHPISGLAEAKRAINRRYLPDPADLATDTAAFRQLFDSPEVRAAITAGIEAGLQSRGPLEYSFGD